MVPASRGVITEKILYEISKSWGFAEDFRISGKDFKISWRFQDFMEISRFHGDFRVSRKISGFPERFCKIDFNEQDFQIPVQILTY